MKQLLKGGVRAAQKPLHVEVIDLGQQFAERARAVIEQAFAFLRGSLRRIADGAAWMKILRLPRKRRRPMRGKPAIFLFHGDAGGEEIGDLALPDMLGIS